MEEIEYPMDTVEEVKVYTIIDENGFAIDTHYGVKEGDNYIAEPYEGFVTAQWVDGQWVEGNPDAEAIKKKLYLDQKRAEYMTALSGFLNEQCIAKGFTGDPMTQPFRSIANYVGFDNQYRADAEALGAWVADCFEVSEQIEADIISGDREVPTIEEYISELPALDA